VDLDPREANCCAWTKHVALRAWGLPRNELCGVKYPDDAPITGDNKPECCGGRDDYVADCDHKYFSTGFAWEDFMDFSRDESLWLKEFAKAWHMATENGMELNSLDSNAAQQIEDLQKDQESVICTDFAKKCDTRTNCRQGGVFELYPEYMSQYRGRCLNKYKTQSNQRKELMRLANFEAQNSWSKDYDGGMNAWTTKYRNLLQLQNATASSSNGKYEPPMVLQR